MKTIKILRLLLFVSLCSTIQTTAQEIENLSVIDRWPYGPCEALFSADSIIFAGNGSALQLLKLSEKEFEKLSEIDLKSFITDIYVKENNVIAGTKNGVTIIDISDIYNPFIKKNFYTYNYTQSVQQINTDVYYSDYYEVNVIKNFESDNYEIYKIHSVQGFSHFYIEDSIAFITDTRDGIYTYDISNLNDIKQLGFYKLTSTYSEQAYYTPSNIYKYKNCVLVPSGYNGTGLGKLFLLGINEDKSLYNISSISLGGDWSSSGRNLVYKDSTIFCSSSSDVGDGLHVFEISNNSFIDKAYYNYEDINDICFLNENNIIISGHSQFSLLDISNTENISEVSFYKTSVATNTVSQIGSNLYTGTTKGIDIFSFQNHHIQKINNYYTNASVYDFLKSGNILYAGGWPSFSVNILDISNIAEPKFINGFYNEVFVKSFKQYNNLLFAIDFRSGFEIFDITNPETPTEIYRYESYSGGEYGSISGYDIQFKDSLFFFSTNKKSIYVFQIKNNSEVTLLDSISTPGYPTSIAIKENYLYTAQRDYGLIIYDITDIHSISKAGQFQYQSSVEKVFIIDTFAYLLETDGLYTLDISDLLNPVIKGHYKTYIANNFSFSGDLIFLSEGESGFTILRNDLITATENSNIIPPAFSLEQNYPNPFNPATTIHYSITKNEFVEIKIYNSLGQEIKTLVNERKEPGNYSIAFNGSNLSSGVYFYRLQAGSLADTKKMVLLK